MLPSRRAPIKPFGCAVPLSGNFVRNLIVLSGLDGRVDPDFWLINVRIDVPFEPFSFRSFHGNPHTGTGGARNLWMAAMVRVNRSPLTATSAIWKVIARAWQTTLAPISISRV